MSISSAPQPELLCISFVLRPKPSHKNGGTPDLNTSGRLARITRLLALAIKFDDLLRFGTVKNFADLARLGHVSRARITQIMNLLNLAPDLQEQILFLPGMPNGPDPFAERDLR